MKKVVRLTESDLARIVKLVIKEDEGKTKDENLVDCLVKNYGWTEESTGGKYLYSLTKNKVTKTRGTFKFNIRSQDDEDLCWLTITNPKNQVIYSDQLKVYGAYEDCSTFYIQVKNAYKDALEEDKKKRPNLNKDNELGLKKGICSFDTDTSEIKQIRQELEKEFICVGTEYSRTSSNNPYAQGKILRKTIYEKNFFTSGKMSGTLSVMLDLDTFGGLISPGDLSYYYKGADGKKEEGSLSSVKDALNKIKKYQK